MDRCLRLPPAHPPSSACGRVWWRYVLLVALLASSPAPALGQNPFAPLPSQPSTTPTLATPTTGTPSSSAGGLSSAEQIGLFGAGVLFIGGIAFLIRRDARARAPVSRGVHHPGARATTPPKAKRVEQSRARAKAARRQRKRARR